MLPNYNASSPIEIPDTFDGKGQHIPAIYVHIPFCTKICPFCSFAVIKDRKEKHQTYLDFLAFEIAARCSSNRQSVKNVASLYLGGGTPSKLSSNELDALIEQLHHTILFTDDATLSIELNPEDVTSDYLKNLQRMGINRISLGVQSLNKTSLAFLGRNHDSRQAKKALSCIQKAGIADFNLDFLFGYPGQTLREMENDLLALLQYDPPHLSAYLVTIEKKTAVSRNKTWLRWASEKEELQGLMYERVVEILSNYGVQQYEVSNFAKPGFESRQNVLNWEGKNYLGLGLGAHSYLNAFRSQNHRRMIDYRHACEAGQLPFATIEQLTPEQKRDEALMIELRLAKGIDLPSFQYRFGVDIEKSLVPFLEKMTQEKLTIKEKNNLKLTPKGLLLADEIAALLAANLT